MDLPVFGARGSINNSVGVREGGSFAYDLCVKGKVHNTAFVIHWRGFEITHTRAHTFYTHLQTVDAVIETWKLVFIVFGVQPEWSDAKNLPVLIENNHL